MGNFNSFIDNLDMDFWHEICAKNGKLCRFKKGEFFVQRGDVVQYLGFVKEGYFKYVVTDSKGNEHITSLALPGKIVGDYLSTTKKIYNPQIQISVVSGTKRSIFRQKNKTKRSKKRLHTTLIKPEQKVNEDLCSGFIVS